MIHDPLVWLATAAVFLATFALLRLGAENQTLRDELEARGRAGPRHRDSMPTDDLGDGPLR